MLVQPDRRIAVHVAEESDQQIVRRRPGLGLVIAQVLHAQAHFFHDLPRDRLLRRLPDLDEARHKRMIGDRPPCIAGEDDLVAIGHRDDDRRLDPGIDPPPAGRAADRPLVVRRHRRRAAGPAEAVVPVPPEEMGRRVGREHVLPGADPLRAQTAQRAERPRAFLLRACLHFRQEVRPRQEPARLPVQGEQVQRLPPLPAHLTDRRQRDLPAGHPAPEGLPLSLREQVQRVPLLRRGAGFVFDAQSVGRDILDHEALLSAVFSADIVDKLSLAVPACCAIL